MSSSRVVALLMAAGYSRRFGHRDKRCALLPDSRTLLGTSVANAQRAFSRLRTVVRDEDNAAALGLPENVPLIGVRQAHLGLGASLAEAVAALSNDSQLDDVEAVAILLGDMPYLRTETLLALQRLASRDVIVRPSIGGRPGHPVIFGRRMWPALEMLSGSDGAKSVVKQYVSCLQDCPVEDKGILRDIDAPEDLKR